MGKIIIILGKSSSGKDTIYKELKASTNLLPILEYTTRPIRENEVNGKDYFFVTEDYFKKNADKVIEKRSYNTIKGVWTYGNLFDHQFNLKDENLNYLLITTLEAYKKFLDYFGQESLIPIYIHIDDGIRLERALKREKLQKSPDYSELCRRFLVDQKDFSDENLERLNISKKFTNDSLEKVLEEIKDYLSKVKGINL